MRLLKKIGLLLILFAMPLGANAQFFKKLKKKVEDAVENTVIRKTSDKAANEVGKSMDKILNGDFGGMAPGKMGSGSMENLPNTYDFDWAYEMEMESSQFKKSEGSMAITYYLKKDAPYWGSKINAGTGQDMFMVYDGPTNQMVMLFNQDGNKVAIVNEMPELTEEDMENNRDYKFSKIPGKTILGYDCEGVKMENDENEFLIYLTYDAPVSFTDIYKNNKQIPKDFEAKWLIKNGKTGMMMAMDMKDKNKPKESMSMTCTRLEKENFKIKPGQYKNMMGK